MSDPDAEFRAALLEIGHLTYVWTNTESLLVHIIAGLLGCDKDRALLVYLTLNTTRARIDLVERLAKSPFTPPAQRDLVLEATRRLARLSGERNFYNHAIYAFDLEEGAISTIQMRIADRGSEVKLGRRQPLDEAAVRDLREVIASLSQLNQTLWQLIRSQNFPL
ncbi:hypothetical protein [Falsigemmobacter faecalis]|uniref:Uncharacterized protein n=1 Tax=Falsigemmobacter faecalis TaxID=2488730 RepID=A0A3P3D902_9RHOB|nr:hypothetical protein [Falsigemmobacter faecalis]RRH68858.1 hypothetical protein EG244_19135 [Falsigemmobacter faecalis]